jgi:cell division protein FtsW
MRNSRSWILVIIAALLGIGLVMVFSATLVHGNRWGTPLRLIGKQAVWLAVGVSLMMLAMHVDYNLYRRWWKAILVVTLVLLVAVLLPGVGSRLNGARRWFLFAGVSVQPSEFAKIGVVVAVAAYLSEYHQRLGSFVRGFAPALAGIAVIFGLIAIEPDAGTALLVGAVAFTMMLVGGVRIKHLLPLAAVAVPVVLLAIFAKHEYIERRVNAFLNPELDPMGAGYQARQAVLALGSGGLFGKGLGCGEIKNLFLPEAHTDFVLAVMGEELGLAGTLLVVGLFVALVYHGMKVAQTAPDKFAFLVAFGLTLFIGLQAAINIAVETASVPTKGISLPLVSYGGSSLVSTLLSLGIVMNISKAGEGVEHCEEEFVHLASLPDDEGPLNELAR